MRVERAGELLRRINVTDNVVVSTTGDMVKVLGRWAWFKVSVNYLGMVPAPSDLLQRLDSRRVPPLPDDPSVAL